MPRVLLFLVLVGVAVIVYALIDCIMTKAYEVRSISKPAWLLTIILVPLVGAGLWFLFGRPRSNGRPAKRNQKPAPRHPTAPDDDPQFLRNLEMRRRQQAKEEELKRREKELREQEKKKKNDGGAPNGENPGPEPDGRTA